MRLIKPHLPLHAQEGHVVLRWWDEPFIDRLGNRATLKMVEYKDKKNKVHQSVMLVRWL